MICIAALSDLLVLIPHLWLDFVRFTGVLHHIALDEEIQAPAICAVWRGAPVDPRCRASVRSVQARKVAPLEEGVLAALQREALADGSIRDEAVTTVRGLIDSVTIHDVPAGSVVADVTASTKALVDFARNEENPRRSRGRGCSVELVTGTRTGRCHKSAKIEI